MRLVNETPFEVGYLPGRLGHPAHSLTLVVKGTFRLVSEGPAVLAKEPRLFAGDEPDEDEGPRSLRYPLDLVPFKPRADLMLVGTCHAGSRPVSRCKVSFSVGAFTRELVVLGDRIWNADGTASEPKPFVDMELVYERSFGGPEWPANPVGCGFVPPPPPPSPQGPSSRPVAPAPPAPPVRPSGPLPNLNDPAVPFVHAGQRPPPAGFGPLRRGWKPRADKVGTYDAAWRKERWPWVPADFDFGHFNCAPEAMQVPFLRGDEPLRFEHLHPTEPLFRSALPGQRVRCLMRPVTTDGSGVLREVPMVIDTLWVDMETQTLVLLWRGVTPVASPEIEKAVEHLFVTTEGTEAPRAALDTLAQRLALALTPPAAVEDEAPPPAATATEDEAATASLMAEAEARTRAVLTDAGLDPDQLPVPTDEQAKAQAARLAELGFPVDEDAPPSQPWTRARVAAAAGAGESLAGADLSGLDLSDLELGGADLTRADLTGTKLCACNAAKAKLDGALFHGADLSGARLQGASLVEADLTEAKLERADLTEAILERAVAERANFGECRLERARAKGLNARKATFASAACGQADFTSANLAGSRLDKSDWRRAILVAASLHGVSAAGIDAREADLTGARASEHASFTQGRFAGVRADRSSWREADLTGSDLSLGSFERADFSDARLDGALLVGAQLKYAKFARASLQAAKVTRANLFRANLEGADLSAADFTGASLYQAETLDARLDGTVLTGADVKGSKLAEASV